MSAALRLDWVTRGVFCLAACTVMGCGGSSAAAPTGGTGSAPPLTPSVTVTPASASVTTAQTLSVSISVGGSSGSPAGTVVLSSGAYASPALTLNSGSATQIVPPGLLTAGLFPREVNVGPDDATLYLTNYSSRSLQIVPTR